MNIVEHDYVIIVFQNPDLSPTIQVSHVNGETASSPAGKMLWLIKRRWVSSYKQQDPGLTHAQRKAQPSYWLERAACNHASINPCYYKHFLCSDQVLPIPDDRILRASPKIS